MEDADVKQLISWIESAHLPYEVDESGTVSIICDPTQIDGPVGGIECTILPADETGSPASLLSETFETTLVGGDDTDKSETGIITIANPVQDTPQAQPQVIPEEGVKEKEDGVKEYQDGVKEYQDGGGSQEDLQLPTGQYFLQTPDGQIIQVFGSLGQDLEEGTVMEIQKENTETNSGLGDPEEERDGGEEGMQILVVGGSDGEEIFLISAGGEGEERIPMTVTSFDPDGTDNVKLGELEQITIHALPSDTGQGEEVADEEQVERIISATNVNNDHVALQQNSLTSSVEHKEAIQVTASGKSKLPFKLDALGAGTLVRTDKGDMVAYNLSSLPQLTQARANGSNSKLQNIASRFGSSVKVLRPVDATTDEKPAKLGKRLSIYQCDDCGAALHSERSRENHRRRFHHAWQEECFVCAQKFISLPYLRAHMIDTHGKDGEAYKCWRCAHESHDLKEFMKHCKDHETSRTCSLCWKKYVTPKLFQEHVRICRKRRNIEMRGNEGMNEEPLDPTSPSNQREEARGDDADEEDRVTTHSGESKGKRQKRKYTRHIDTGSEAEKIGQAKRQARVNTGEQGGTNRIDQEFQIESKHYSRQMKQLEMEPQKTGRRHAGRDRTHRCYLCFKFFPTTASLNTHKEAYHQASSERPVRVKTDTGLEEREEEELQQEQQQPSVNREHQPSTPDGLLEEVMVKEEPPDLLEEFENVTIVMDAQLEQTQIIKPLCVACQTHTSTDYRKQSRWFNRVPDNKQSAALKKFQQFLPRAVDPDGLAEPWVLCKKCAILIDKIAEMEDKLVSMKHDLLARVRGEKEANQRSLSQSETSIDQVNGVGSLEKDEPSRGKNLAEIEAYMKRTCEIMEITRPQKGRGRPRREQKTEVLTPVLGTEEDCVTGIAKYIANGVMIKKEYEGDTSTSSAAQTTTISNSMEGDSQENTDMQDGENASTRICAMGVQIKEEPVHSQFNSRRTNSEDMEWDDITSLTAQQEDQFSVERVGIDPEPFSADMLLKGLVTGSGEAKGNERVKGEDAVDDWASETLSNRSDLSSRLLPVPSCGDTDGSDGENSLPDHVTLSTQNSVCDDIVPNDMKTEGVMIEGEMEDASLNDDDTETRHHDLSPDAEAVVERGLGILEQPKVKVLGKKRTRVKEERDKMCYSAELDKAGEKPWRCRECHKGFSSQRGACDHYASSHGGLSHTCQHCPASYVRKRDLIGHYNRVHLNIKPYKCKIADCPKTFSSHGELYRHLGSSHPAPSSSCPTTYFCDLCGVEFKQKRYRDAHIPVCISQASDSCPYKCPLCQKAFKLPRYMQLHMRSVHCWRDEQYFCELCHKVLTDKRNLVLHMKSHLGQTKTTCQVCGKQFARKSYLWTHMRVHSNERPYTCTRCPKSFKQYSTWKNHERTHTGEKPYQCNVCRANFSTSSSLSKHMQYAHYKIRDFVCEICKKAFISKTKLEEHIKVHTGEKPFKCPVCQRAFNKKNNLRTHMYVHSGNKRYNCELCGEGFMRRSAVESHILERHNLASDFLITRKKEDTRPREDGAEDGMTMAQFISMAEEEEDEDEEEEEEEEEEQGKGEDTYIVVYADDGTDATGEMQVTVLAEDTITSQLDIGTPLSPGCRQTTVEDAIASNVLSEIVLDGGASTIRHNSLTTLISPADVTQGIAIGDAAAMAMGQVVEIDEAGELRLVAGAGL